MLLVLWLHLLLYQGAWQPHPCHLGPAAAPQQEAQQQTACQLLQTATCTVMVTHLKLLLLQTVTVMLLLQACRQAVLLWLPS
jgi:hypothetical protein